MPNQSNFELVLVHEKNKALKEAGDNSAKKAAIYAAFTAIEHLSLDDITGFADLRRKLQAELDSIDALEADAKLVLP